MSWNITRTLHNLEYELDHRTRYMDSNDTGTVFSHNITADKFIKTGGGSSLEYWMTDGSTSSGSNVGTGVKNPMITNLNANNYAITNVSTINNVNIDNVNSDLAIVKDKTFYINPLLSTDGTVFNNKVYAQQFVLTNGPVVPEYLLSDGSTVSIPGDVDGRITSLETKTQNFTATSNKSTITKSLEFILDTSENFSIRSSDGMRTFMIFNPTKMNLYRNLDMQTYDILNVNSIKIGDGTTNGYIKSNGTVDTNTYAPLTSFNTLSTTVSSHTNSITQLTNDKLNVDGSKSMLGDLNMNFHNINNLSAPVENSDATTKLYVDNLNTTKLNTDGTNYMTGVLNMGTKNIVNAGIVSATQISLTSGTSSQFLLGNGGLTNRSDYLTSSSTDITNLQSKTQNINATSSSNTISNSTAIILENLGNFIVRDDELNPLLGASEVEVDIHKTLNLNNNRLTGLVAPSANSDGTNKQYVDDGLATKLTASDLSTLNGKTQNQTGSMTRTTFTKSSKFLLDTLESLDIRDSLDNTNYLQVSATAIESGRVINMNTNKIQELGEPTLTTDAATKNYADGKVSKTGDSTITGNLTATKFIKSGGLSTQFLMANGDSNSTVYPTVSTVLTGNATYNGTNIGYTVKRIGIAGHGICSVFIGGWSSTAATTTSTLISSSFLPATYRPLNAIFFPCRISKNGTTSVGTLIIYASGELGITDVAQTTNYWAVGNTCGMVGDTNVTFCTL